MGILVSTLKYSRLCALYRIGGGLGQDQLWQVPARPLEHPAVEEMVGVTFPYSDPDSSPFGYGHGQAILLGHGDRDALGGQILHQ